MSDLYKKLYDDGGYGLIVKDVYVNTVDRPPDRWFPSETKHFSAVPIKDKVIISLSTPKIRKSFTIPDDQWDQVWRTIQKQKGVNWDAVALAALKGKPSGDYMLTDKYACTLFDNETILVFDGTYKNPNIEPATWDEEDLVVSQGPSYK